MAPRAIVGIIPGDDAAPEAMAATLAVVAAMELPLELRPLDVAGVAGTLPDAARPAIDACDTVLFGAAAHASVPALFHLRWGRGTFANVRPIRWFPGLPTSLARPKGVDLVIVRENLEDAYLGLEGDLAALAPLRLRGRITGAAPEALGEGRFAVKAITRGGTERVSRAAFDLARRRRAAGGRGRVTISAKWNMLPLADGLFRDVALGVAGDYPDVATETLLVDDCAHRLARDPARFDVILLPNLYGDILSDLAAGLVGGLGAAASGCFGDGFAYFESVHGTAPDIAGRGIINPTATLLSAAMMLDYLGLDDASTRLRDAVARVYADGRALTPDVGGTGTTRGVADAVVAAL